MKGEIQILTDSLLKNISSIEHGFFTRNGGVSEGYIPRLIVLTIVIIKNM